MHGCRELVKCIYTDQITLNFPDTLSHSCWGPMPAASAAYHDREREEKKIMRQKSCTMYKSQKTNCACNVPCAQFNGEKFLPKAVIVLDTFWIFSPCSSVPVVKIVGVAPASWLHRWAASPNTAVYRWPIWGAAPHHQTPGEILSNFDPLCLSITGVYVEDWRCYEGISCSVGLGAE